MNVLPFDPSHGADQARQYATKYASKPEKWYFLDTQQDGVKNYLKCRTVGLCMAHNRLMGFHVVRSTRPVQFTYAQFVQSKDYRTPRESSSLAEDTYFMNSTQKYFFRSEELRHMRIEQFQRYFSIAGDGGEARTAVTMETTVEDEDDVVERQPHHRHYDSFAEHVIPGSLFQSARKQVGGARRRQSARLGVSRVPFIEPLGDKREYSYEARLLLGLPWYCVEKSSEDDWLFRWDPPEDVDGSMLEGTELRIALGFANSFEQICADLEKEICKPHHTLVCPCCIEEMGAVCPPCMHALGFHHCENPAKDKLHSVWRKGTLFAGSLDIERAMFNLHRKGVPTPALSEKAQEYVDVGLVTKEAALKIMAVLEAERSVYRMVNEANVPDDDGSTVPALTHRLSPEQMVAELADREAKMQAGGQAGVETDQWRVYQHIIGSLQRGEYLRLMVQASAGTGKSFLLTTVYLWCIVNHKKAKAAAPTGIAAANVEIEGTDVCASTIHTIFDLDTEYKTKLDFAKLNNIKVATLMAMEVLLLDEVSMIDTACWSTIVDLLSIVDHNRRPNANAAAEDPFGHMHVLLFGDFKQLPPATSKPPFIVTPAVTGRFAFRVLRENRRVCQDAARVQELENFHQVLTDISWGRVTARAQEFIVRAYVSGAETGCAEKVGFDGSTSVFTKRRYRDKWNRTVVRRVAKGHNHTLKVKGKCRPKGARGQYYAESKVQYMRKRAKTQALFNLLLAGDFHATSETKDLPMRPHMMRVMLVSNLAVDQRFANGTQDRS